MGQCAKVSGLARFWGESEFVIWLAADHLRLSPAEKIANVLFHELLHIGTDPDTGDPKLVGHDLEFFFAEVSERGLWRPEMEQAHEVFTQLRLIPYEAADEARNIPDPIPRSPENGILARNLVHVTVLRVPGEPAQRAQLPSTIRYTIAVPSAGEAWCIVTGETPRLPVPSASIWLAVGSPRAWDGA